jgi:hypothetical protein
MDITASRLGLASLVSSAFAAGVLVLPGSASANTAWKTVDRTGDQLAEVAQAPREQPVQVAQAQQAQQKVWSYSLGASLYYDSFESDDNLIESDQLSEYFVLNGTRSNLWHPGDALTLTGKFGFVQAWPERGGDSDDAYATPTDILVSAAYSTWDKKTSGFTTELYINIPSGPTDFSLTELAAIPNPKIVSVPVLSEGFQIGAEAQYHRQINKWHLHGGFGYLFRTGISGFDVFDVDELEGGHDVSVLAGADYQLTERWNIGVNVNYTHSFEEEGGDNDYVSVSVPLIYLFERGEASLTYTFSYSSAETRELTRIRRDEDTLGFLDGLRHTIGAEVGYKLTDPFVIRAIAEASIGDAERPSDPAFFTTENYFIIGLGGTYTLASNLSLQGLVKYFEVSTKGAAGGSTTFDGVSAMLSLQYGF